MWKSSEITLQKTSRRDSIHQPMLQKRPFALTAATTDDAKLLAELHTAVAAHLTQVYGQGPWSAQTSEKSILFAMRNGHVFIARQRTKIIATLRLNTKKPWAI